MSSFGQPEPWARDYIGMPFVEKGRDGAGVDCWGLIALVLERQGGIQVPTFEDCYCSTEETELLGAVIAREKAKLPFRPIALRADGEGALAFHRRLAPLVRPLDVLLLRMMGDLCHVGIACGGGQFLHTEVGINCVMNAYAGPRAERWRLRLAEGGVYRHRGLEAAPDRCAGGAPATPGGLEI